MFQWHLQISILMIEFVNLKGDLDISHHLNVKSTTLIRWKYQIHLVERSTLSWDWGNNHKEIPSKYLTKEEQSSSDGNEDFWHKKSVFPGKNKTVEVNHRSRVISRSVPRLDAISSGSLESICRKDPIESIYRNGITQVWPTSTINYRYSNIMSSWR